MILWNLLPTDMVTAPGLDFHKKEPQEMDLSTTIRMITKQSLQRKVATFIWLAAIGNTKLALC